MMLQPQIANSFLLFYKIIELVCSQIVCGQNCTFMVSTTGGVLSCGEGSYGRLGQGNSDDLLRLTIISTLQGRLSCRFGKIELHFQTSSFEIKTNFHEVHLQFRMDLISKYLFCLLCKIISLCSSCPTKAVVPAAWLFSVNDSLMQLKRYTAESQHGWRIQERGAASSTILSG